jgi:hypothetical protein
MEKIVPPNHYPSNGEEIARIRRRHLEGLGDGMTNAQASAYANDPIAGLCLPATLRASLGLLPSSAMDTDTACPDPGPQLPSLDSSPPLAPQQELTTSIDITGLYYPEPEVIEAPLAQDFSDPPETARVRKRHQALRAGMSSAEASAYAKDPPVPAIGADTAQLGESDSADGSDERPAQPNAANSRPATVDRLPNGKFPPGRTGNPKGRPKKPSDDVDPPSELERILERTITVTQGGKKRKLKQTTAIFEQWVNQAVKGDHRARRELIAYADKHGIDLFRLEHKAIGKALAAAAVSSSYILSPEVMDRLSPSAIDEIHKVIEAVEAEKGNSRMH